MNKKFLSAILFGALMVGSTVTFTGCIDNDEPAGITDLRGAKAELLRAKVAVEAANAAYINAQAQIQLALAERQNLLNEGIKLDNQLQELENQEKSAAVEAAIAKIKADLEVNKLQWEQNLLTEKANLAKAQKAYEDAMKALELSKEYLSDAELAVLENVQNQYNRSYAELYGGSYYVVFRGMQIKKTVKVEDSAKGQLDAEYKTYEGKVTDPKNYMNEASLQEGLLKAQTNLDKKSNELAIKQETLEALESGDAYNAWLALKAKYNEKLDSLDAVLADKKTKKAEIIASETNHSIKDLQKVVTAMGNGATGIIDTKKEVAAKEGKDSTFTVSAAIKGNLATINSGFIVYHSTTGVYTAKFETGGEVLALTKTNKNDKTDVLDNAVEYATLMDNTYGFADGDKSEYKKAVKNIDDAIKAVNKAKEDIDANEVAYAKDIQAAAKEDMEAKEKTATTLINAWRKAVTDDLSGTSFNETQYNEAVGGIKAVLNGIKSATTDNEMTEIYNRYIAFRETMEANGQTNKSLDASIKDGASLKTYVLDGTTTAEDTKVTSLVPDAFVDVNTAKTLFEKAYAAFGKAGIFKDNNSNGSYDQGDLGVREQPADKAIKEVSNYGTTCGAQGAYLAAVVAYNTATENVEKAEQFDKVITQLTKWKASLAAAKTAYVAKYQDDIDAVVAAQTAVTEKVENPIAALKIDAAEAMKDDIDGIITSITKDNPEIGEFEDLIADLKKEIDGDKTNDPNKKGLKEEVKEAEGEVLKAEKMIELFKAGNLKEQHVIEWAEASLAAKKTAYEQAVAVFNYWSGKLADITETLYSKSSAE